MGLTRIDEYPKKYTPEQWQRRETIKYHAKKLLIVLGEILLIAGMIVLLCKLGDGI